MVGQTHNFFGFPFFKVGTFNGQTYTEDDLGKIAANFQTLKDKVQPPLKLGHASQKFLKDEGMPAAGWVEDVRQENGTLVADIANIPHRVYQLLTDKAYNRPSAEIYTNFKDEDGKEYGPTLSAIALLGADPPAIKTLPAIEALFKTVENRYNEHFDRNENEIIILEFADNKGGSSNMTIEQQIAELQSQITTLQQELEAAKAKADDSEKVTALVEQIAKVQLQLDDKEKEEKEEKDKGNLDDAKLSEELTDMKTKYADMEKQLNDKQVELDASVAQATEVQTELQRRDETTRVVKLNEYITKLKDEGKILPAQEAQVIALMATLPDDETDEDALVTFTEEGKEPVKLTPLGLYKATLEANPDIVKFEEMTTNRDGKATTQGEQHYREQFTSERDTRGGEPVAISDVELAELAEKLEKEEKLAPVDALIKASIQLGRQAA